MKKLRFILQITLILIFGYQGQASDSSNFLTITDSFSFIAMSGHRIEYLKETNKLSIISPRGIVLASGEPFLMRTASARKGYFEHGFSVSSTSDSKNLEYAMILRTKLKLPKSNNGFIDPSKFIDTKTLVSTSFWITDQVSEAEILNSTLFETEAEISKAISINKFSAGSCKSFLN